MSTLKTVSIFALALFSFIACGNSGTSSSASVNGQNDLEQSGEVQHIKQPTFDSLNADSTVIVIDVRTPGEIQNGYISGTELFIDYNARDFESKINALDKNKTYVMYCRSGGRSSNAANYMIGQGFTTVYNLQGGIMNYGGDISK